MTILELRGRRVVVTGGLGFIGSNVAHACARSGASVLVYDSLDPTCGGNLANIQDASGSVEIAHGDIRSRDGVAAALRGADVVINCAAYTSHVGSMTDPRAYVDVNCMGLLTVLEAAGAQAPPPRFVQIGSSTQIGRAMVEPITEDHPEFPVDVYSATKTAGEKLATAYGAAHGIPVSVVRLANVYGPRAKIRDGSLGFVNYFVGLALRDEEITVFGDGAQRRTITYVDDVVDAILRVAVSPRCVGEVFFAAGDRHCSVRDVSEIIVAAVGAGRIRTVPWPKDRSVIEVGHSVISSEKIARYTGWRASTGLEDGMRATAAYFASRRDRYLDAP